jgi:cytochrome c biogenesis protein CcmG, thiol:disulfide interchange protein DsbE
MKLHKIVAILVAAGCLFTYDNIQSQNAAKGRMIPSANVKTLKGETTNTANISNDGKPIIISFWATWCKPCIEELTNISEVYPQWQKETGVKLYAISIDDARTANRVPSFVNGRNWPYEILLDANSDFKRSMNVNMPPHTFLVNGKGEIVWQHVGYVDGNEDELYEQLKKVAAEK